VSNHQVGEGLFQNVVQSSEAIDGIVECRRSPMEAKRVVHPEGDMKGVSPDIPEAMQKNSPTKWRQLKRGAREGKRSKRLFEPV
jgi:hypothetical protein